MTRDQAACKTVTVSNEQAFDRYRRTLGLDLAHPTPLIDTGSEWGLHTQIAARWMARYSRRRDILQGVPGYGEPLADSTAVAAITARNIARDAEWPQLPAWDEFTLSMIGMSLRHLHSQGRLDVSDLAEPCRCGPSLRRLWNEARTRGMTEGQAWAAIVEWANARPPVWQADDARKRRKQPAAGTLARLQSQLTWQKNADLDFPWATESGGERWQVRINDFPDEHMYTLYVNGEPLHDFDNWPETWDRGDRPAAAAAQETVARLQPPQVRIQGRFLERYLAGEHETVWAELLALGPDVRKKRYREEATAVARETMRRVRHNVELLIVRLDGMNYDFGDGRGRRRKVTNHLLDQQVFVPPAADEKAQLDAWERQGVILPLSLRLWMEEVGRVELVGSHPALCFLERGGDPPPAYADPLMVVPTADSIEDFLGLGDGEDDMFMSFDDWGKAAVGGDVQIDSAYSLEVPNQAVDGLLRGERHQIGFVDYLRLSFRWGGFPGWEGQAQRPERELAALTQDLLAF